MMTEQLMLLLIMMKTIDVYGFVYEWICIHNVYALTRNASKAFPVPSLCFVMFTSKK